MDKMAKRTSESISIRYFCMNGIENCQLGDNKSEKAITTGGIGEKLVRQGPKLAGQLPHLLYRKHHLLIRD